MIAVAPGLGDLLDAVGEGKERVGGRDCAFQRQHRFLRAHAAGIHAAHLSGANAHRLAVARVEDGVRLYVLADLPGKQQRALFFRSVAGAW